MAATSRPRSESPTLPLVTGVVAGAVTFVVGYLFTFLLKSGEISNAVGTADQFAGLGVSPPGDWQIIGWFFYQMHNVGIELSLTIAGQTQTETVPNNVETWLFLVPVVLLVVAGFAVAKTASAPTTGDGVKAGLTVTAGYFVPAIAFAFLTTWSISDGSGSFSFGPSLVMAALLAGIAYPAILGGIGGALAGVTGN